MVIPLFKLTTLWKWCACKTSRQNMNTSQFPSQTSCCVWLSPENCGSQSWIGYSWVSCYSTGVVSLDMINETSAEIHLWQSAKRRQQPRARTVVYCEDFAAAWSQVASFQFIQQWVGWAACLTKYVTLNCNHRMKFTAATWVHILCILCVVT